MDLKVIDAESPIVIFFGTNGIPDTCNFINQYYCNDCEITSVFAPWEEMMS